MGALFAYLRYEVSTQCKRRKLEEYLKTEKLRVQDEDKNKPVAERREGKFSVIRIMKDVALTEDEIIQASFRSSKIRRFVTKDSDTNIANDLLFQYVD